MNRFAISFGNYFSASLQSPPADGPAAVSADPRLFSRQWSFRQQFFDDFVETADEFSDFLQRYFGVGRHKAVMPNFREAVRQHVLEIAPHKLEEFEFADAPLLLPAPAIFEMHMGSGDVEYPTRRNGDAEDIRTGLRPICIRKLSIASLSGARYLSAALPLPTWRASITQSGSQTQSGTLRPSDSSCSINFARNIWPKG